MLGVSRGPTRSFPQSPIPRAARSASPRLPTIWTASGEHTHEVLGGLLGYDGGHIADLLPAGVIAAP